ncbi:MAG: AAA family ATPase [Planctomycetes bacterium]|nr:AAA family ATPase [Planctomycetota bacterium]
MTTALHDILGQDRALDVIRRAIASGRLHHAWIFHGPRGIGKFTTATALAKILLDPAARVGVDPEHPDVLAAEPGGRAATLVDAGTHPDLHVIRKELALFSENPQLRARKLSNIPLDVLREHMIGGKTGDDRQHEAPAYRTAALGHNKVFIIDEAELIDQYGQNALLKTLEEPPPQTFIFLVTDRAERLLPTIRSRCQLVRFAPLVEAAMETWFDRAQLEVSPEQRAWLEWFADGAPGIALLGATYGFPRWQETLDPMLRELARGEFPVAMGAALAELVEEYATAWVKRNANASKDAANKDGARHVIALLAAVARRRLGETCADEAEAAPWMAVIDLLREAEAQLRSNVNMKQVLENLVVQWARVCAPVGA